MGVILIQIYAINASIETNAVANTENDHMGCDMHRFVNSHFAVTRCPQFIILMVTTFPFDAFNSLLKPLSKDPLMMDRPSDYYLHIT